MLPNVFHCGTCDVSFASSAAWREHAKTETHVSNLRARVASNAGPLPTRQDDSDWATNPNSEFHTSSEDELQSLSSDSSTDEAPEFVPEQCLFCGSLNGTSDQNMEHMDRAHSFTIPQPEHLVSDPASLMRYLHLAVYWCYECLQCGKTRWSVEGIQHHMMQKAHCKLSITKEVAQFYELPAESTGKHSITVDGESTTRLPSGKVIGNRTQTAQGQSKTPRRSASHGGDQALLTDNQPSRPSKSNKGKSTELMSHSERAIARVATQLSQLSASDQKALAHLPANELRSVLSTRAKQLQSAKRKEQYMRGRLEAKNNRTMMKHFVADVPGRSNG